MAGVCFIVQIGSTGKRFGTTLLTVVRWGLGHNRWWLNPPFLSLLETCCTHRVSLLASSAPCSHNYRCWIYERSAENMKVMNRHTHWVRWMYYKVFTQSLCKPAGCPLPQSWVLPLLTMLGNDKRSSNKTSSEILILVVQGQGLILNFNLGLVKKLMERRLLGPAIWA